jgi:hypothetical protein
MAKEAKSQQELLALLREKAPELRNVHMQVKADQIYGWQAHVMAAAPAAALRLQEVVEQAARDLRSQFDLESGPKLGH